MERNQQRVFAISSDVLIDVRTNHNRRDSGLDGQQLASERKMGRREESEGEERSNDRRERE